MSIHFCSFNRSGLRRLILVTQLLCWQFQFSALAEPENKGAAVDALERKARRYSNERQWGKAQSVYRQVLQLRQNEWGPDDVRLIGPLNDLIRVTCVDGKCANTVPYLNRLLAIRLKKFGRRHGDVATTYALIAEVNEKMHRYPAALKNFAEAVKIRDLLHGKTDAISISSRVNIIRVSLKNEDKATARKMIQECQTLLSAGRKPAPELEKLLSHYAGSL